MENLDQDLNGGDLKLVTGIYTKYVKHCFKHNSCIVGMENLVKSYVNSCVHMIYIWTMTRS